MNNIQNLHVVIPQKWGSRQPNDNQKSPLQNVSKLIAVQGVKILTPSKLWRLSTLDEAMG
ncbi:hypothetical protein EFK23_11935 [Lactococcus lactis subsp. lactis]|nr:hypothetical protein [Lactococcus lactis subsp. lactis]